MKLNKLGLYVLVACIGFFAACSSSDKYETIPVANVAGIYKGNLTVKLSATGAGENTVSRVGIIEKTEKSIDLILKNFEFSGLPLGDILVPSIPVRQNKNSLVLDQVTVSVNIVAMGDVTAKVHIIKGEINDGKLSVELKIDNISNLQEANIFATFNGDKLAVEESSAAKITKLEFTHEAVQRQPLVDGSTTNIVLNVKEETDVTKLTAVPFSIEVSDKATVIPADNKLNLSSGVGTLSVVAEDGTKINYTVRVSKNLTYFDMETWYQVGGVLGSNDYYAPHEGQGWASSNNGMATAIPLKLADRYGIVQTDDAYAGKSAAKIETILSKGKAGSMFAPAIPKIIAGSLYTGTFKLNIKNVLSSTKFGIPFVGEPEVLSMYYKYVRGAEYHVAESLTKPHITTVDASKEDLCAIYAVLYEYNKAASDADEALGDKNTYSTYLTGENIQASDKIISIAALADGKPVATYTKLELKFQTVAGKTYDAKKHYRLAIILSSSYDGNSFNGAPESSLFVDNVGIEIK